MFQSLCFQTFSAYLLTKLLTSMMPSSTGWVQSSTYLTISFFFFPFPPDWGLPLFFTGFWKASICIASALNRYECVKWLSCGPVRQYFYTKLKHVPSHFLTFVIAKFCLLILLPNYLLNLFALWLFHKKIQPINMCT